MTPRPTPRRRRAAAAPDPALPEKALATLQEQLLDISSRNRLINTPVDSQRAKQIKFVDEDADELFRILYRNRRRISFKPAAEDADGAVPRRRDSTLRLQTALGREQLDKRLLSLYRDARLMEEEQGVSVLFLSLGFLRWDEAAAERYAPLILLPVDLSRSSASERFTLELRDQDLEPNLSLRGRLENDFQITLPDLPTADNWRPSGYFRQVQAAVAAQDSWKVYSEILILGFYSFAKFVMWRDVDAMNAMNGGLFAANPSGQELIGRLLGDGFDPAAGDEQVEENLDRRFPDPRELGHVLDADASQTEVIAAARAGGNLVVQGPPGTGKSQTIANIIAVAARDEKTVLFVAEKRAALEVVHARLRGCGLGSLCLELRSRKANRKAVLEELKRTLDEGQPHPVSSDEYDNVRQSRDELNAVSEWLHRVDPTTGATPFEIIGEIAKLRGAGCPLPDEHLLPDADSWSRKQFLDRCERVRGLAETTAKFGPEQQHPWRGVGRRLTPIDHDRLRCRLEHAAGALEKLCAALDEAATATGQRTRRRACGRRGADEVEKRLAAFAKMPPEVPDLLQSAAFRGCFSQAAELAAQAAKLSSDCDQLLKRVYPEALDHDWAAAQAALADHGRSLLRWFNRAYRNAVDELRSAHRRDKLPRAHRDRLARVDELLGVQHLRRELQQQNEFGSDAFGRHWGGEHSDGRTLAASTDWIKAHAVASGLRRRPPTRRDIEALQQRVEQIPTLRSLRSRLQWRYEEWTDAWHEVARTLELSVSDAFGHREIAAVRLATVRARLAKWLNGQETLADWSLLAAAAKACSELGLDGLRARLGDGRLGPADAVSVFRYARAEAVWRRLAAEAPLAALDGAKRTAKVAAFRRADEQLRHLAAQEVALLHHKALPAGSAGKIGIVRAEIRKQRRHFALRKLLDRAGEAVIKIKPIFLMSPLSVAQFLRPGGLTFHILVIDEASQVRPADALGAIARAQQIIVVGDDKQLPPTSFFDRQLEGVDEDEQEPSDAAIRAAQATDMESILTLCQARSVPDVGLLWHYRSHHPSLIEVSNDTFYDNRLIYPPSPDPAGEGGLTFTKVEGVYDRGGRRSNPREAQEVARAVLCHALSRSGETLGVATFSVAQRDAILDELEPMRKDNPPLDAFCREEGDGREPFFVKNLENVQGDERDVIFISVGYGRNAQGHLAQSFGPVSQDGGERRLNVLFTRARRHCRVFASITHRDIRRPTRPGPRALKRFLKFAETGEMSRRATARLEPESPFEEAVTAALRQAGHKVDPQVGMAGFRIDLAVRDPASPERYLLGVEWDGVRYHSSRWARERDRLRQSVLEQKGWTMHRIWSTDWFWRPDEEPQRLLQAVDAAQARREDGPSQEPSAAHGPPPIVVERDPPTSEEEPQAVPYREADFDIPERVDIDLHEARPEVVADYVVKVVRCEAPVHVDEVARRLCRLWDHTRNDQRVQGAVRDATGYAVEQGWIALNGSFLRGTRRTQKPVVRDRREVQSGTLRKPALLPPEEVECAILQVVEQNVSLSVKDCAVQVARRFGFRRTSEDLRRVVDAATDRLVTRGRLQRDGAELRLAAEAH